MIVSPNTVLQGGRPMYSIVVDSSEGKTVRDVISRISLPLHGTLASAGPIPEGAGSSSLEYVDSNAPSDAEAADVSDVADGFSLNGFVPSRASPAPSSLAISRGPGVGEVPSLGRGDDWDPISGRCISEIVELKILQKTGRLPFHLWNGTVSSASPHFQALRCQDSNSDLLSVVYDDSIWYKTSVYTFHLRIIVKKPFAQLHGKLRCFLMLCKDDGTDYVDNGGGIDFHRPSPFDINRAPLLDDSVMKYEGDVGPFQLNAFSFVHHGQQRMFRFRLRIALPDSRCICEHLSPPFCIKSKKPKRERDGDD
jgi:hypothetical protein